MTDTAYATRLRVVVIVGSVREGRFGPTVAGWFAGLAQQRGDLDIEVIDLVETPLPPRLGTGESALSARLAAADAFVVVTPEYNKSFPAPVKDLIDWHFTEWQAKPVGFVSYGGMSGGLRAVEQLRLVFTEMHAMTLRDTVSFHAVWERFGQDGTPKDEAGPAAAAKTLLDQLAWWANALRAARAERPYGT